jgi:hypothetical protein
MNTYSAPPSANNEGGNASGSVARRVETACRCFIVFLMLVYGIVKVFQGQFYTDEHWRDTPLGELDGQQLAWSFFSHAPLYESLVGTVEVIVALLFLSRRTTTLAIVLFIPLMANVVAMNIFFEIGALATAIPLLAAGFVLLSLHWHRLKPFFWDAAARRAQPGARPWLTPALVVIAATSLAGVILFNNLLRYPQDPGLRGGWTLVGDGPRGYRVYFEKGKTLAIRDDRGDIHFSEYWLPGPQQLRVSENPLLTGVTSLTYHLDGDWLVLKTPSHTWLLTRARRAAQVEPVAGAGSRS